MMKRIARLVVLRWSVRRASVGRMTNQAKAKRERQARQVKVDQLLSMHRRYAELEAWLGEPDNDTSHCELDDPRIAEYTDREIELVSLADRIQLLDNELFTE